MKLADGPPAVLVETADDEAFLLGTKSGLVELAHEILRIAGADCPPTDMAGFQVRQPESPCLTEPMADVVIAGIVVVDNEEARRALIDRFVQCPVDWQGYDENRKDGAS